VHWYTFDGEYDDPLQPPDIKAEKEIDQIVIEGPIYANNRRGSWGKTWWARQWLDVMETRGDTRLGRGRTYARNGSVSDLVIQKGAVLAQVRGSSRRPYKVWIAVSMLSDAEWQMVVDILAEQSSRSANLLAGDMPVDIEDMCQSVGVSLFPSSGKEIEFGCTCPDWGYPCKHAAAVNYLLAEQLDRDPFILFHLRGRTQREILDALRFARQSQANDAQVQDPVRQEEPLSIDATIFWAGANAQSRPVHSPGPIPRQPPVLTMLGDPPGRFGHDLRRVYQQVSETALARLSQETELPPEPREALEEAPVK